MTIVFGTFLLGGVEWIERTTWQVMMLVGLVLLIKLLLGKWLSATAHYFLWLPVLLHLVSPLLLTGPRSLYSVIEYVPGVMDFTRYYYGESRGGEYLLVAFFLLWGAGFIYFSIRLVQGHLKFKRLLELAVEVDDPAVCKQLAICKLRLGIERPVRLVESSELTVPAVTGLLRPTIVLPEGLAGQLSEDELKYILLHELAHSKNGDLWVLWLTRLVDVIHWFNPVVRFANFALVRNCERACDARVLESLEHSHERKGYGEMLLRLTDRLPPNRMQVPAALFFFSRNGAVKRRIYTIARFKPSWFRRRTCALLLMFPVLLIAAYKPAYYCVSKSLDKGGYAAKVVEAADDKSSTQVF